MGTGSGRADEEGGEEDLEVLLEFEQEVALRVRPVRQEDALVGGVSGGQDRRGCGDEGVHEWGNNARDLGILMIS